MVNSDESGGVFNTHGFSFVPAAVAIFFFVEDKNKSDHFIAAFFKPDASKGMKVMVC
jgi:hypothetical protein